MLQDHLKSSSAIVAQNIATVSRNYYLPFGGNRAAPTGFSGLTTKRFTGQYHEASLPGGEGLSYYGSRWYDAKLGRFLTADSIVPGAGNPQAFNRYSYVLNRPTGMTDPSGHEPCANGSMCVPGGPDGKGGTAPGGGSNNSGNVGSSGSGSTTGQLTGSGRYVHTYYGAEIDVVHFGGGMAYGRLILNRLGSGEQEITLQKNLRAGYGMIMVYRMLKDVPRNQIEQVALSIYLESEREFENWQGNFLMPGVFTETLNGSSFSNEDMVSDYLGFYAAARYPGLDQEQALQLVVSQLGGGVRDDNLGPHAYVWPNGHISGDWRSKNFQTTPKVYFSNTDTWMNVDYPMGLRISPASNDGLWIQESASVVWPSPASIWKWLWE